LWGNRKERIIIPRGKGRTTFKCLIWITLEGMELIHLAQDRDVAFSEHGNDPSDSKKKNVH
jgi:hypothetical protein